MCVCVCVCAGEGVGWGKREGSRAPIGDIPITKLVFTSLDNKENGKLMITVSET